MKNKEKELLDKEEKHSKVSEEFRSYKLMAQTILKQKEKEINSSDHFENQIQSLKLEILDLNQSLSSLQEENNSLLVLYFFLNFYF